MPCKILFGLEVIKASSDFLELEALLKSCEMYPRAGSSLLNLFSLLGDLFCEIDAFFMANAPA